MSDHLVLCVDRLIISESLPSLEEGAVTSEVPGPSKDASTVLITDSPSSADDVDKVMEEDALEEEQPLIHSAECRICQEEDSIKNFEIPCACTGSLKFVHRKCVQRWCTEKGNAICEICNQPYQPGYTAPPPSQPEDASTIDISEGWTISSAPLNLRDPQILMMAAAEHHFQEAEYDDYGDGGASGAAFFRSAALVLLALLLLRHALSLTNVDDEDDASAYFSLFLLRAAGFLLPCYIMAWAINILQRRRQRQDAAALAATEVAFMLQADQHRQRLPVAIPPGVAAGNPSRTGSVIVFP